MNLIQLGIAALESGMLPDAVTRVAIRRLCQQRLIQSQTAAHSQDASESEFRNSLSFGPIAPLPEKANEQHYELPPEFFTLVLGPRRKYSSCYFPNPHSSLAEAEDASLEITCQRAQIENGQRILELGCGWGSLTLWIAEKYPDCQITAVSNSAPQRKFIEDEAAAKGFENVRVVTADMNDFEPFGHSFDRIVSVEMFEHMRNYQRLLARIGTWLMPGGKLFVHIFCHRQYCYPFETRGAANWMGQHFFTGGIMPSSELLYQFNADLNVSEQHTWNGQHYQRTAEQWLANMDANRESVLDIMKAVYGDSEARRWFNRWRTFFLAVSELFGYQDGEEWFVGHYLLDHRSQKSAAQNANESVNTKHQPSLL